MMRLVWRSSGGGEDGDGRIVWGEFESGRVWEFGMEVVVEFCVLW
jgi:hypothetical protein